MVSRIDNNNYMISL